MAAGRGGMTPKPDLLVVGAGPAGLALALQARAHGARVRLIERRRDAFRPSRALILHPRTLEALRPLGVTDALLARADRAPAAHLHLGARMVPASLAELALPDTAFPHLTLIRQLEVETVLARALKERGVAVERGVELLDLRDEGSGVRATLRTRSGVEEAAFALVAGCDGPESTVRGIAGIGWEGGAYREEAVLADVELAGELVEDV
ncbi:MAG TPA: FAD-dependent monooxygenase, partial [Nitrolancea sp.]|nr:FAD-dependent monooxygenase [Nitrolancea sp.]